MGQISQWSLDPSSDEFIPVQPIDWGTDSGRAFGQDGAQDIKPVESDNSRLGTMLDVLLESLEAVQVNLEDFPDTGQEDKQETDEISDTTLQVLLVALVGR